MTERSTSASLSPVPENGQISAVDEKVVWREEGQGAQLSAHSRSSTKAEP